MNFSCGVGTAMDLLPNIANSMCINRKFEDDSELELAIEQKMF